MHFVNNVSGLSFSGTKCSNEIKQNMIYKIEICALHSNGMPQLYLTLILTKKYSTEYLK